MMQVDDGLGLMFSTDLFSQHSSMKAEASARAQGQTVQLYHDENTRKIATKLKRALMCPELCIFKKRLEHEFLNFGMEDGTTGVQSDLEPRPMISPDSLTSPSNDTEKSRQEEEKVLDMSRGEDEKDQNALLNELLEFQLNANDDIYQLQSNLSGSMSRTGDESHAFTVYSGERETTNEASGQGTMDLEDNYDEPGEPKLEEQLGEDGLTGADYGSYGDGGFANDYQSTLKRLESRFEIIGQGNKKYFYSSLFSLHSFSISLRAAC